MKKSFLAILFCLAFTAMFAQNSPTNKANTATERMTNKLDLDNQQIEKVRAAYLEIFVATAQLKESDKATRSTKQQAIQSKFDQDLANILTPEQTKKWNEIRKDEPALKGTDKEYKKRKSNVSPKDRIMNSSTRTADRMTNQLQLSDDQRDQVLKAHTKKLTDIQTLRTNNTERNRMIKEKKRINKEYQTTIDNILTPEQIEKREMIRSKRIQQNNNKLQKGTGQKRAIQSQNGNSKEIKRKLRMEDQSTIYTDRMAKKLDLTEDQIAPFYQAFLNRIADTGRLKRIKSTSREAEKKEIMTRYKNELRTFLTPEQMQKLDQLKNEKKRSEQYR